MVLSGEFPRFDARVRDHFLAVSDGQGPLGI